MAKSDPAAGKLKRLAVLTDRSWSADDRQLVGTALTDVSNRVVQRAAELIAEREDDSFEDELLAAYQRLLLDPIKHDPGCLGKLAIVKALVGLEYTDADFYRSGIAHRQWEPVWGKSVDTAAELRGTCAIGLINSVSRVEVLNRCAELLVDEYPAARVGAARAIATLGLPEGAAVLRLKLLIGDADAEVLGECCSGLLHLDRAEGISFVLGLLASPHGDMCVQAGLALGEKHVAEAFEPLRQAWCRHSDEYVRKSLLVCIALLRLSESREFLLSLIDRSDLRSASDAIRALHVGYETDEDVKQGVAKTVEAIGDANLNRVLADQWQ